MLLRVKRQDELAPTNMTVACSDDTSYVRSFLMLFAYSNFWQTRRECVVSQCSSVVTKSCLQYLNRIPSFESNKCVSSVKRRGDPSMFRSF